MPASMTMEVASAALENHLLLILVAVLKLSVGAQRFIADQKPDFSAEEPRELDGDQLQEVVGGLTHPTQPNYYPVVGGSDHASISGNGR